MIRATTDSEKSNITLHVCHCDQSVTVRIVLCKLIQGIERIAELNHVAEKTIQYADKLMTPNLTVIPVNAGTQAFRNHESFKSGPRLSSG